MDRVNGILTQDIFIDNMMQIDASEIGRIYCKHGMAHALDVARIMLKRAAEVGAIIDKDVIYATALLHDIGRASDSYGLNHARASVDISHEILKKSGYNYLEIDNIALAIANHSADGGQDELGQILYFADKKSRACYQCKAADSCKWDLDKRNKDKY